MRILLTNDDGVYAPGLRAMYRQLIKLGEVVVVAPDGERSSISQAITLNHPIYHRTVHPVSGFKAHAISGTPADCVKFALAIVFKKVPDLIVSGINHGSNDGCSVFYSGTVGAAREGALAGIPSVAVSLDSGDDPDFDAAAKVALKAIRWSVKAQLPCRTFMNVNIPDVAPRQIKGLVLARQCRVPIHGEFIQRKDPMGRTYYWLTGRPPAREDESDSDTFALQNKYAVMTPVMCDSTDHVFLHSLKTRKGLHHDQL